MTQRLPLLALPLMMLLAGCSQVREELGMARNSPDEFRVTTQAPLAMPPDFNSLPAPQPGAARPQQVNPQQAAAAALGASIAAPASPAESLLLRQAGATQTDPNIRRELEAENAEVYVQDQLLLDQLIGRNANVPQGELVDPNAERDRLRQAQSTGQSLGGQEVPQLQQPKTRGLFGL